MYPILFSFLKITIYSHGVLVATGLILGGVIIFILARDEGLSTKRLLDLLLYSVVAGLIGARINYIISYHNLFSNPGEYFAIWRGGMVSYGGIIFGFGFAIWYLYKIKENVWRWLDIGVIGLMLGWTFGRIGCFLAGDILGKVTKSSFGLVMPAIDSLPRQPVPLYEAFATLIIFAVLLIIYKTRVLKDGLLFFAGFGLYFIARFIIEFTRIYEQVFAGLSFSQIALIILFIISFYGFISRARKPRVSARG